MQRVAASPFVPRDGAPTPVPSWKREDWVPPDALPVADEGDATRRDPAHPELPAAPDY